ncbi:tRNA lysidine(34) synthetase TilS [Serpentinicella alkaliphila]|uniref:tRNA(Ile)-lysidine synthase n=1 Tax=Serpentinicella alkaliphila TaxID=1734049 RepID=A0A4R2SXY9_9FIRM|nr:tRNA lysidine(34) synthetase TilS [Serpentinicella alkaliphila]QUH25361.1 tRNA lysidine(34) synthetase TilS [Serpentinicella alkaliphila]TCP93334.1 tRNA(Ile)-lysidine synthase [Serpentinicella alkaliphila]
MINKVKETIFKEELIQLGDKIIVGISGGPDSVCLLHLLWYLQEEYKITVYGAHLNHNFRGIESQLDAHYVSKLCEEFNIICFIKSVDVAQVASIKGISFEEAGRLQRYQFFEEISEKVGANKIAVAHNLNDQAETILMRFLRGTGLEGLTAIPYNRGKIIRPLLNITRAEIEEYCSINNLSPRIDKTNLEPIYHRNKIRLELMPYLMENYNPNIIDTLARTSEILKKDNSYIEAKAREMYKEIKLRETENRIELSIVGINKLHESLKARVLRFATEDLVGKKDVLEYKHINSVLELLENGQTAKKRTLPMGIIVRISYERLIFSVISDFEYDKDFIYELQVNSLEYIEEIDQEIRISLVDKQEINDISRDKYIKCFDYDKVNNRLNIRNRRDGDRFWPLGLTGSKKLKDFFIDLKIDREERDLVPLLCDGDEIMWVVGYRMSEAYKVSSETTRVLMVEFCKEEPIK